MCVECGVYNVNIFDLLLFLLSVLVYSSSVLSPPTALRFENGGIFQLNESTVIVSR